MFHHKNYTNNSLNHKTATFGKKRFFENANMWPPSGVAFSTAIPAYFYSDPIHLAPINRIVPVDAHDDYGKEELRERDILTTVFLTSIASIGIFALYQLHFTIYK